MIKNSIRFVGTITAAILFLLPFANTANAQQSISTSLRIIVYPAEGQPLEKQNMDEGECYAWAQQQTGLDPMTISQTPAQSENSGKKGRERLKGAAGGAAGGAAIGAISGDAGKGAGIGTIAGTMLGGRKARQNKAAQEQQAKQAQSANLEYFQKAFGVCMEGRGYTVN